MALHRSLEGQIREAHAGEIAERLAEDLLSLVVNAGLDRVAVVLIDDALAELLERLAIRLASTSSAAAPSASKSAPRASIAWVRSCATPMPIAP